MSPLRSACRARLGRYGGDGFRFNYAISFIVNSANVKMVNSVSGDSSGWTFAIRKADCTQVVLTQPFGNF